MSDRSSRLGLKDVVSLNGIHIQLARNCMPKGLVAALIFWGVFLALLYIGIFGSNWNIRRRIRAAKSTREVAMLWVVRILYIIALPIVFVMVLLGAKFMWDDLRKIIGLDR